MKSRHELQNDYEEALFAIIMDDIMELEGRALLEERKRLSESDEFKVPDDVHERCIAFIDRLFKEKDTKKRVSGIRKVGKIILIAAIVMSFLVTSVCAFVPSAKAAIYNLVIVVAEKVATLTSGGEVLPETNHGRYQPNWLPIGVSLYDSGEDDFSSWEIYKHGDKSIIICAIFGHESAKLYTDAEDAYVEQIVLDEYEGILIIKEERIQLDVFDTENYNYIEVVCTGYEKDEAVEVLRNMVYQE